MTTATPPPGRSRGRAARNSVARSIQWIATATVSAPSGRSARPTVGRSRSEPSTQATVPVRLVAAAAAAASMSGSGSMPIIVPTRPARA